VCLRSWNPNVPADRPFFARRVRFDPYHTAATLAIIRYPVLVRSLLCNAAPFCCLVDLL
jgi:hypothetical protein